MNGLKDIKDLHYLQITGQSQLAKEVGETRNLHRKFIDEDALHRNEVTHEMEGAEFGLVPTGYPRAKIPYDQIKIEEVIANDMG